MVLDFAILADYAYISIDGTDIFATHGHIYNENNLPKLKGFDILLHGHTHVPLHREVEGITIINPGSVSIPKENSVHGYIVIENRKITWKDFDGNVVKIKEIRGKK